MNLSVPQTVALIALIFGVLANTIKDPAAFGVSDIAVHWISVIAQIASTVAAWLATSPKGPSAPPSIDDPTRFRD